MLRARPVGLALAAAALLVIAACSSDEPTTEPTSRFDSYVAMGDSSVAGPGISPVNPLGALCARSTNNWPALLATKLKAGDVKDVSCSGATSADILNPKVASDGSQLAAQIDALSADTDLVTISIGGNDEGTYTKMVLACLGGVYASDSACSSFANTHLKPILERTTDRVATTLERIHNKAPQARIVMVGYLRLFPDVGGCAIPGLTDTRIEPAAAAWEALDEAMRTAAERSDAEYVSMATSSDGHVSCDGDQAWVTGLKDVPGDGALLHPNSAGMRAVAKVVADHLAR